MVLPEHIWYAAYGSNIDEDRFRHYLQGGVYPTTGRWHAGSRDQHPVMQRGNMRIGHTLYFAGSSAPWEGHGVAFLDRSIDEKVDGAYVRLFLISPAQFRDVLIQENGKDPADDLPHIDLATLLHTGTLAYGPEQDFLDYGQLLLLGTRDRSPILTFTTKRGRAEHPTTRAGIKYLRVIAHGLQTSCGLDEAMVVNYLGALDGVRGHYPTDELTQLLFHEQDASIEGGPHA